MLMGVDDMIIAYSLGYSLIPSGRLLTATVSTKQDDSACSWYKGYDAIAHVEILNDHHAHHTDAIR
jgi:hypothetical protein